MTDDDRFLDAVNGKFISTLRWKHLDALWATLAERAGDGWYIYAVGEAPPAAPSGPEQVRRFLMEIRELLERDHDEDYCGIVYADSVDEPSLVKIYDPNNLGSVCGSSGAPPPLPGWILSILQPIDLAGGMPQTGSRRRWWQRMFG